MHPLHIRPTTTTTATMSPSKSPLSSSSNPNPNFPSSSNCNSNSLLCKHSPSATLDLLILILVLFSGAFLLTSYFSYLFNSLSLLLSANHVSLSLSLSPFNPFSVPSTLGFLLLFLLTFLLLDSCFCPRSRKCDRPGCKGMKKAMEFDLQLQTDDCVRSGSNAVVEIDRLPWKGGSETNPDYECLRAELRKMAPPNGRAVLLFRTRCGCPVAKLEGWGPKKGRRNKKALATINR